MGSGTKALWFDELELFMLFAEDGLGRTELGGRDLAGDVTFGSRAELADDPEDCSCAGAGWF